MNRRTTPWTLAAVAALASLPLMMGQGCPPAPVEEPAKVSDISPADAQAMIENHPNDPNFVIIDVRTPTEFATGHIANAINICVLLCEGSFTDAISSLDKSKTYLVYCGSNHRSPTATQTMIDQGFTTVYNMLGGLGQWKTEGRPVVQ
jgi:rhodanese-related sulfurtransferase